jgi:hypothetical protein
VVDGHQVVTIMVLPDGGQCRCGQPVAAGSRAGWDVARRRVVCPGCVQTSLSAGTDDLVRVSQQHERRSAAREERLRRPRPRAGGAVLAGGGERERSETRRAVADLCARSGPTVRVLRHRRLGVGRRGTVRLLAVGPAGVTVVEVLLGDGARVEVVRSGGLLRPWREQLLVGQHDRTAVLDGLARQEQAVRQALLGCGPDVVASSLVVAVDAVLPRWRSLVVRGVSVLGSGRAADLLRAPGPWSAVDVDRVHAHLARALPPA